MRTKQSNKTTDAETYQFGMSAKHTAEPWIAEPPLRCGEPWLIHGRGAVFATFGPDSDDRANSLRAVACVNACAGLNPAAVPALVAACRAALALIEELPGMSVSGVWERIPCNARMAGELRAALALAEKQS